MRRGAKRGAMLLSLFRCLDTMGKKKRLARVGIAKLPSRNSPPRTFDRDVTRIKRFYNIREEYCEKGTTDNDVAEQAFAHARSLICVPPMQ